MVRQLRGGGLQRVRRLLPRKERYSWFRRWAERMHARCRASALARLSRSNAAWACRLKVHGSKSVEDMRDTVRNTVPPGLAYAFNLGHADVFPATSGKENAAAYIMDRFDATPATSFLLCDDDNDLGARAASATPSCACGRNGKPVGLPRMPEVSRPLLQPAARPELGAETARDHWGAVHGACMSVSVAQQRHPAARG